MPKKKQLSKDTLSRLQHYRDKWLAIAHNSEPCDSQQCVEAVRKLYKAAGVEPPSRVLTVGSPYAAAVIAAVVGDYRAMRVAAKIVATDVLESRYEAVWEPLWKELVLSMYDHAGHHFSGQGYRGTDSLRDKAMGFVEQAVGESSLSKPRDVAYGEIFESYGSGFYDMIRDSMNRDFRELVRRPLTTTRLQEVGNRQCMERIEAGLRRVLVTAAGATNDVLKLRRTSDKLHPDHPGYKRAAAEAMMCFSDDRETANQLFSTAQHAMRYGCHDSHWLAYYDFFMNEAGIGDLSILDGYMQLAKNCGWWSSYYDYAIFQDRPLWLHLDDDRRLHSDKEASIKWPDGWGVYVVGGVMVDEQIIHHPETQTLQQIRGEENAEVKRVRIERFGWDRYLKEIKAKILDQRENAIEATKEFLAKTPDGEVVLVCACPSTARVYALEVASDCKTCEDAQNYLRGGFKMNIIGGT